MSDIIKMGRVFWFEAAHHLPNHEGLCRSVHGHSYKLIIEVEGPVQPNFINPEAGMVMDYGRLKKVVTGLVLDRMDHAYLNDIFPNPTAENMVIYIVTLLKHQVAPAVLTKVELWETRNSYAKWERSVNENI